MLSNKEMQVIRSAIKNDGIIRFEYYPNKYPKGQFRGTRYVNPIRIYTYNGKEYLLAIFLRGVSASQKGFGYRVYFLNKLKNVKDVNPNGFEFEKILKPLKDYEISKMIYKNEVE